MPVAKARACISLRLLLLTKLTYLTFHSVAVMIVTCMLGRKHLPALTLTRAKQLLEPEMITTALSFN